MSDEHDMQQPQDELSEEKLAEVSGGFLGGDPDRPVMVGVVPNKGDNKNPNEPQQGIQDGTSNTIMLK